MYVQDANILFSLARRLGQMVFLAALSTLLALATVILGGKVFLLLSVPLVAVMLCNPQISLLITAASTMTGFMFYLNETSGVVPVSIPKLCGLVTLASLVLHVTRSRTRLYLGSKVVIPLVFVLLSGLSLLYGPAHAPGVKTFVQLCGGFAFYFLAVNVVREQKTLKQLLVVLVAAYTLLSLYSVIQYFLPSNWTDEYKIQTGGVYQAFVDRGIKRSAGLSHPGVLSFILTMLLPYVIYLWRDAESRRQKALFFLSAVLFINVILLSHTRVAFLALLLIGVLLYVKRLIRIDWPIVLGLVLLGTGYLFVVMPDTFVSRVLTFSTYAKEGSVGIRLENQRNALRLFAANPATGIGLGTFESRNPADRPVNLEVTNMLLEVAVELGVLGLLAMLVLIYVMVRDSLRMEAFYRGRASPNLGSFVFISIVVGLVFSLFMSNQDFREWWLLISIPAIGMRIIQSQPDAPELLPVR